LDHVTRLEPARPAREQPLPVHERPAGRPEVLDGQLLACPGDGHMACRHPARWTFLIAQIEPRLPVESTADDRFARA
jgi:hypothetical protein